MKSNNSLSHNILLNEDSIVNKMNSLSIDNGDNMAML